MSNRDAFLRTVREAVQAGNQAAGRPPLPSRGDIGYQGAGADPIAKFCAELQVAGGVPHPVADLPEAKQSLAILVEEFGPRQIFLGHEPILTSLEVESMLTSRQIDVIRPDTHAPGTERDAYFACDLAISGVDYAIAETGSLVVRSRPDQPRSLTLLPPTHIAIVTKEQLLADLFDFFATEPDALPAGIAFITGPSKTGDIELKLVTGVHGPGTVHVIVIGVNRN